MKTIATFRRRAAIGSAGLGVLLVLAGCARETGPVLSYHEGHAAELRQLLQEKQQDAGGEAVVTAEPTGWGTLKGKFTLVGTPPPRLPLNVNKDVEICAPGGKQPLEQSIVIGPDNGIQNVLIYLSTAIPADNPKWEHESYAENRDGEIVFDQKNCIFLTHVAAMRHTQTMKVLNSDPVGHNTNLDSKRGAAAANFTVAANVTNPANAPAYVPQKPSPAPFSVSCSIHPWMQAWLMVCDSPYFAVTQEDGSFEMANVPAGVPLEFRVWQERSTYLQDVSVDGTPTQWKRGRFTLTLNDGETREMNVAVDGSVLQ